MYPHVEAAITYANEVMDGTIPACKLVIKAAERFANDLQRRDLTFRPDKAEQVCRFIENLPHVKGEWAAKGERIRLEPWQCFKFVNVFGFYKNGLRRYREVYAEVPRKNGKSIDAAAVGLFMLCADGEFGAEVYCGATTEKQALEVFRPAKLMCERDADLREYFGVDVRAQSITRPADGSFFQRVIGNPGDGSSPSCGIVDEYHEHTRDNVYKTFQTGMGAREQPLLYVITTAGDNLAGPCYQKREEAVQILEGVFTDEHADSTFVLIYSLDPEDDWTTELALRKANPNYDVSVSGKWLRAQQEQAIRSASAQGHYKTKHLNIWVNATEAFLNFEEWKAAADPGMRLEDFEHLPCIIGVDLSDRVDFTASCKVFYEDDKDGRRHYWAFPTFWLPSELVIEKYETWREWIVATEGNEIDTRIVKSMLAEDIERHSIGEVVFDPWKSAGYEQELEETGAVIVKFPQTIAHYTTPMNELEAAIKSGRLHHPDNPVLNWMASNLTAKRDTNGNVKPRKEVRGKKIDGMCALIMAMGRALAADAPQQMGSIVYL